MNHLRSSTDRSQRQYLDLPYGQLHVIEQGGGGPAVVLLHESPLSAEVFGRLQEEMSSWAHTIAVDTPGYGSSDPPSESARWEIPDYAAAVLEGLRRLRLSRVTLLGVHTGAAIAAYVAAQAVAEGDLRVEAIALLGLPFYDEAVREDRLANWAPPEQPEADGSHLTRLWRRYETIWPQDTPTELRHLAVTQVLRVLDRYHVGYNAAFRCEAFAALRDAGVPTLFLVAPQDRLADADRRAHAQLPGSRLVDLATAPAQAHMRAAPEVSAALESYLDELASGLEVSSGSENA